jgi:hypothetical protein
MCTTCARRYSGLEVREDDFVFQATSRQQNVMNQLHVIVMICHGMISEVLE